MFATPSLLSIAGAASSAGAHGLVARLDPGRYPSGQRGWAVNPLRYRYVGSNPTRPTGSPFGRAIFLFAGLSEWLAALAMRAAPALAELPAHPSGCSGRRRTS